MICEIIHLPSLSYCTTIEEQSNGRDGSDVPCNTVVNSIIKCGYTSFTNTTLTG